MPVVFDSINSQDLSKPGPRLFLSSRRLDAKTLVSRTTGRCWTLFIETRPRLVMHHQMFERINVTHSLRIFIEEYY